MRGGNCLPQPEKGSGPESPTVTACVQSESRDCRFEARTPKKRLPSCRVETITQMPRPKALILIGRLDWPQSRGIYHDRLGFDDAKVGSRHHHRSGRAYAWQDARAVEHYGAWYRLHHRRRYLRSHRHGGGALCRPRYHALLRRRRNRLCLRRLVLLRVRRASAGLRQHLHLYLCNLGRDLRLDHRLGPHPRIRHGRLHRRRRLVRLYCLALA